MTKYDIFSLFFGVIIIINSKKERRPAVTTLMIIVASQNAIPLTFLYNVLFTNLHSFHGCFVLLPWTSFPCNKQSAIFKIFSYEVKMIILFWYSDQIPWLSFFLALFCGVIWRDFFYIICGNDFVNLEEKKDWRDCMNLSSWSGWERGEKGSLRDKD